MAQHIIIPRKNGCFLVRSKLDFAYEEPLNEYELIINEQYNELKALKSKKSLRQKLAKLALFAYGVALTFCVLFFAFTLATAKNRVFDDKIHALIAIAGIFLCAGSIIFALLYVILAYQGEGSSLK